MALYEDGKIKLDDEFIDSFKSQNVRDFLQMMKYNLADSSKSPYCTVENLLYNNPICELIVKLHWYILGKNNTTCKTFVRSDIDAMIEADELRKKLEEIENQIKLENDW
jgi:hypothetical protein